jgi:ribosomal protein L14
VSYAWTKISGPTQYTIVSPGSASTQVNNLTTGIYGFRLLVTDNGSATAADTVLVTVKDAVVPNQPPIARAGADVVLTFPKNKTNLNGSASTDPDGSIVSYAWTKISGPLLYSIANPNSANTQVSNLITGVYAFRLRVTDNSGATAADTVVVTVNSRTATTLQEAARTGTDTSISLSNTSVVPNGPSLSDQAAGFKPLVYPNPTSAGFVLDFSLEKKQTAWITITSGADGRVCYTETLNKFPGRYHKNLGLVNLAKGSYAITIRTETVTKTIILVKY